MAGPHGQTRTADDPRAPLSALPSHSHHLSGPGRIRSQLTFLPRTYVIMGLVSDFWDKKEIQRAVIAPAPWRLRVRSLPAVNRRPGRLGPYFGIAIALVGEIPHLYVEGQVS